MTRVDVGCAMKISLLAAALLAGGVASGAQAPDQATGGAPAAAATDQELDEVLVNGLRIKPTRNPQQIVNWLKLLVGKFRYSGYVELRGEGVPRDLLPVRGLAECTAFGRAPGVQCTLNVVWPEVHGAEGGDIPGGVSTLSPAMVQYGLDPDHLGIRYLQVDNRGYADYGQGYLVADTLTTTMPCVGIPGNCQRISKITAHADDTNIEMQVEYEVDGSRIARYRFLLRRQDKVAEGAISGGK